MADDILGHEHLEHGKHLHKGKHAHDHGHHGSHRLPSGGTHVGLGRSQRRAIIGAHDSHGHAHGDHEPSHDSQGSHAPSAKPAAETSTARALGTRFPHWRGWVIGLCIALPFAIALYRLSPGFALAVFILALDALIEYHKWFTAGLPLDFEILFVGSAYVSAVHSLGWGIAIALLGPFVAAFARAHLCEEEFIKAFAVMVTALTASTMDVTPLNLFLSVLFGVATQSLGVTLVNHQDSVINFLSRLTTLALHAYLIFFVIAGFLVP